MAERVDYVPAITFVQWCAEQGLTLPSDYEQATALGSLAFPRPNLTRAARGKLKRGVSALSQLGTAQMMYQTALASGEIPMKEVRRPLDLTREQDRAWVRVQAKRAARRQKEVTRGEV